MAVVLGPDPVLGVPGAQRPGPAEEALEVGDGLDDRVQLVGELAP
jgi:hypothetical protein